MARLTRLLEAVRASEADFSSRAASAQEAARQADAAADAAKQKAAQVRWTPRHALQHVLCAAQRPTQAEVSVLPLDVMAPQVESQLKARELEVARLNEALERRSGDARDASSGARQAEEDAKRCAPARGLWPALQAASAHTTG